MADLRRAASSGIPRQISLSKRPALRRAGSRESGLLVAPMTRTCAVNVRLFKSVRRQAPEKCDLICSPVKGFDSIPSASVLHMYQTACVESTFHQLQLKERVFVGILHRNYQSFKKLSQKDEFLHKLQFPPNQTGLI